MASLQSEIEEFFVEYSKLWNSQRYETLAELWDRDDPSPFYRAMEREQPIATWPELERYWNPRPGMRVIDGLWNIYTNLRPKLVAPDVAIVLFDLEWNLKAPRAKPISGTDPGMAVLKRKPEGWRMTAYVEACMHPSTYVSKLFQENVRTDFVRFLSEQAAGRQEKGPGS